MDASDFRALAPLARAGPTSRSYPGLHYRRVSPPRDGAPEPSDMVVAKIYIVVKRVSDRHWSTTPGSRMHVTAAQLRPRACGYQPYDTRFLELTTCRHPPLLTLP